MDVLTSEQKVCNHKGSQAIQSSPLDHSVMKQTSSRVYSVQHGSALGGDYVAKETKCFISFNSLQAKFRCKQPVANSLGRRERVDSHRKETGRETGNVFPEETNTVKTSSKQSEIYRLICLSVPHLQQTETKWKCSRLGF